ncbi:hypothetical protein GGX14DRAFT_484551 [Mycena pura]|uniref:Uncharacterized protein n=1 Tax=Mycena pura TaxID=153505 RepID=A0AAD6XVR7_9AGAR|nr:hypothetical protein GGX14DRAFT_484551 [Mycena pura]
MFFKRSLLALALIVAVANAFNGTANLGFYDVNNCFCPPFNGPFAIAIPSTLARSATCCNDQITLSYLGQTTTAVFSGFYDAGEAEDIALSPNAFAALASFPWETALTPVSWSFL